jgi:hypothetical protein
VLVAEADGAAHASLASGVGGKASTCCLCVPQGGERFGTYAAMRGALGAVVVEEVLDQVPIGGLASHREIIRGAV